MTIFTKVGIKPLGRRAARAALVLAALLASRDGASSAGGTISGTVQATPEKYLEETVVYLENVPGSYPPRTHSMDQKGMRFAPHVLAITKGDTVKFLNHDAVAHNVYSADQEAYNLGAFKPGEDRAVTFDKATGVYTQLCSIHPEMLGFIFVSQNPYSAVADRQGRFSISGVPPGTYRLMVWNSHLKAPPQSVTIAAGQTADPHIALKR
ncbi:MAG: hypothetical protein LAO51_12150 [Acidobacteriia bacterium]|nr:hypothetical protein [Terriglobia bacterium]